MDQGGQLMTEGHRAAIDFSLEKAGDATDEWVLSLVGELRLENVQRFREEVPLLLSSVSALSLLVDLNGLVYLDSAGALALAEMEELVRDKIPSIQWRGGDRKVCGIMNLVNREALTTPPIRGEEMDTPVLVRIGEAAMKLIGDFADIMTFLGELLTALVYVLRHPGSVRWGDVLYYMKKAGEEALPIVGLISLLIGLIMAFMSSLQLKQFGANIFVASLVGIAVVKELGPMMTAIIVAGRSGSAFAAEIGTMKVNEEVDALITMGFEPVRFLAVPKVLASLFVVPLLTLYAMLFGIVGGLFVGVLGLDLTFYTYVQQTMDSIDLFDIFTSLIKSAVFALLISGIGCQRGFKVFGGAEAVGESATSAVVSAIFLIIVADSAFAVLLHYIQ